MQKLINEFAKKFNEKDRCYKINYYLQHNLKSKYSRKAIIEIAQYLHEK